MSDTLHTDDEETSAEDHGDDEAYADSHGEPLRCPKCGEYVALHYHPQFEFPAHYSGFVLHCECALGPQIKAESVAELHPPWFLDVVQETEERPEDWIENYLHDNRNIENWIGDE